MIKYTKHNDIDFEKWDACITNSINGLPYAYSRYLNIVAQNRWDALIVDDYAAVFPIPFKNRIIYKQAYQPFFTQQLGLFYTNVEHTELLSDCLTVIKEKFSKIYLQLNTDNSMPNEGKLGNNKITHHIKLDGGYEVIKANYNSNTKRNIKKGAGAGLKLVDLSDINPLINFRKTYLADELKGVQNDKDLNRLAELLNYLLENKTGFLRAVVDDKENILSLAFFLNSNGYLIYLSAVSSNEGKEMGAMNYLIDSVLHQYANSNLIFDFEGSMIPGLAQYYKGFGGIAVSFPVVTK